MQQRNSGGIEVTGGVTSVDRRYAASELDEKSMKADGGKKAV
jgi:hypothetical protein